MIPSEEINSVVEFSIETARDRGYEFITPELLLLSMISTSFSFRLVFQGCGGNLEVLRSDLEDYLDKNMESCGGKIYKDSEEDPIFSSGTATVFALAATTAGSSGRTEITMAHVLNALWMLKDCYAVYYMERQGIERLELIHDLSLMEESEEDSEDNREDWFGDEGNMSGREVSEEGPGRLPSKEEVASYAPCLNDTLKMPNPLIGREKELERTIQILCRKEKNNPLHIGEPGVGKTAITYGLVQRILEGRVPDPIKGARVYALDLGSMMAGTQYRGDLEKRIKKFMDMVSKDELPIVYIDEIHNLLGMGATGDSSLDAANLLKPYLSGGRVRFIGATTFEEYKKHFEKNKSLVRRFQNVEIAEPSQGEAVDILKGLKSGYEKFHGVFYAKGVPEYAVEMSSRYIRERFLPDKAIDLIDEAGAYRKLHPLPQKRQTVDKKLIDQILTDICRIPEKNIKEDESSSLKNLETRILSSVYGQDDAVRQVVNAVKYSRAGLTADARPLASLLFAGPTGVGKTEIAQTLARELGVKLIRFDMSEYGEKHSVAKLIGAPAGYVGYEEGGLLTEAVRKNPSSVLLLDEIEKAHPDIFSTLLQVMDYATLTDNQGRKADFRNVVIIMTSNAGAARMGKPGLGFQAKDTTSDVIMEEVKRVFQPEFRNRLNAIVVFRSMDQHMAELIAGKKLRELADLLSARKVELNFDSEAVKLLREKGITREYGARELDRVIQNEIKPLLVDEILFGRLRKGGKCTLSVNGKAFRMIFERRTRSASGVKDIPAGKKARADAQTR